MSAWGNGDGAEITRIVGQIGTKMATKDGRGIAELSRDAQDRLEVVLSRYPQELRLKELYQAILRGEKTRQRQDWDQSAQTFLALAALHNAWTDQENIDPPPELRSLLVDWRALLRFPAGFDSPRSFDAAAFGERLKQFRR